MNVIHKQFEYQNNVTDSMHPNKHILVMTLYIVTGFVLYVVLSLIRGAPLLHIKQCPIKEEVYSVGEHAPVPLSFTN